MANYRSSSADATAWGFFPSSQNRHHAQRRERSAPSGKVDVSQNLFMVENRGKQESVPGRPTANLGSNPWDPGKLGETLGPGEFKITTNQKAGGIPYPELGLDLYHPPDQFKPGAPHQVYINSERPGWAAKNGVRKGDELVSIQGQKVTNMQNANQMWSLLGQRPLTLVFRGKSQTFKDAFQITVCYVKNLKRGNWNAGRQKGPYVTFDMQYVDTATGQKRILEPVLKKPMYSRHDRAISADVLNKSVRDALPINFDHSGIIQGVPMYLGSKLQQADYPTFRFFVKEDTMFGRGSVLCNLELDTCEKDRNGNWYYELHPNLLNGVCCEKYAQANGVEMKVIIVPVKRKGDTIYSQVEDRGIRQELEVLEALQGDAEEGQTELQVSPDTQKTLGLKTGENIFIAPEVDGKREMGRIMKFVQRGMLHYICLDARLKHGHGMGTTLAIRPRHGGIFPSLCACCNTTSLHCFEHCKICIGDCRGGTGTACIISYASCCICWIELWRLCSMGCAWCMGRNSLIDLRRQCARRCSLPFDPAVADDADKDTACCCIPLRTAIFFLSLLSIVIALVDFFHPSAAEGLSVTSHTVSGVADLAGFFFGALGAIGAWELKVNLLVMYNYFQMARLLAKCFMMYSDAPLLVDCDLWRTDINAAIQKYGWNPNMYTIAMDNSCSQSFVTFVLINTFLFWLYIYLISLTRKLIWIVESPPKYLLSMPKEAPSGAFRTVYRTQGKSRPPYGAIDGNDLFEDSPQTQNGLVGTPVGIAYKPSPFDAKLAMGRAPGKPPPMQFSY